jgi:membrane associated rhomboid family serine protease
MFPIRSNVSTRGFATATALLITLNVLAFLFEIGLPPHALDALVGTFGMIPARETFYLLRDPLSLGDWLVPIGTSMFLHGGWAHLVGNMLFLWVFGRALEARLGSARFLGLYALAGLAASQAQVLAAPLSQMPMIGASGAVAGVLGAYLLLFPRSSVTVLFPVFIFPLFFDVPALLFLGIWFLEQLFAGTLWSLSPLAAQAGGVAWWAHVGGFLAGAAIIVFIASRLARERRAELRALRTEPGAWRTGPRAYHVRF